MLEPWFLWALLGILLVGAETFIPGLAIIFFGLGALATAGAGPVYAFFAWAFGTSHGSTVIEPVRTLTQEYGATYVMVVGLLNWLTCFDLFDRTTGRWVYRLPKDEQEELASRGKKTEE